MTQVGRISAVHITNREEKVRGRHGPIAIGRPRGGKGGTGHTAITIMELGKPSLAGSLPNLFLLHCTKKKKNAGSMQWTNTSCGKGTC